MDSPLSFTVSSIGCAVIQMANTRTHFPALSPLNHIRRLTRLSSSTTFAADGNGPMPVYCTADDGKTCRASKTRIQGTLTQPLYLTPAPVPDPPNTKFPGCTSSSSLPKWTLYNLLYYSTEWGGYHPDDDTTVRHLEVEITNQANNFTQSCVIDDPALDGPNDKWFQCSSVPQNTFPDYVIETYIQFNEETQRLALNQTWYCDDTEDGPP